MRKFLFILILFYSCKNENYVIPQKTNGRDLNGFSEYGVYFERGPDRSDNDTLINSSHSKVYNFRINSIDSTFIDINKFYSKDELEKTKLKFVSYVAVCGYDQNGNNNDVGWNQSPLLFKYLNKKKEFVILEQTGFVENSYNFWMHPPRQDRFMQNFTAPWPFIVYNKKRWHWEFVFNGSSEQNIVKKNWTDTARFVFTYDVVGKELKKIENKNYDCYQVNAVGKSRVGVSRANYLFCSNFGIYEYSCVNIDSSTCHFLFDHYDDCIEF